MAFSTRGGKGANLKVVQRLLAPPWDGELYQITGESDIGGRWQLTGDDPESGKNAGGVEEDDNNPSQVGGEATGFCFLFKAVFQSVLIFGTEPWVVTPFMGRVLGGF